MAAFSYSAALAALSGGAVRLCGPSQPLPRTQCLHHDRKHACPDSLCASTSASLGSSGEIAFLGARASVCSVSSTSIRSARGLLSASTNLELALGRGDSPLKTVLSEDSALWFKRSFMIFSPLKRFVSLYVSFHLRLVTFRFVNLLSFPLRFVYISFVFCCLKLSPTYFL